MSIQSVIEHQAFYIEFREDYLRICSQSTYTKLTKNGKKSKASPHCKALLLAVLEHWTNDKLAKDQNPAIYMSYTQWEESIYGMYGRNVIIDSIDELLGEGLISREAYKQYGRDTFTYTLNSEEINKRIQATYPQVTSQPHPLKSKPVVVTNQPDTSLQVNADPLKSKRNIESTKNPSIASTERREPVPIRKTLTTKEAHTLCEQEMHINIPLSPSVQEALTSIVKAGATDTMLRAVIARMESKRQKREFWLNGFTIENVANNLSREWQFIQQERSLPTVTQRKEMLPPRMPTREELKREIV